MRSVCCLLSIGFVTMLIACPATFVTAESLPIVTSVELQPLRAQVQRVADALQELGAPLNAERRTQLDHALSNVDATQAVTQIQEIMDPLCLVTVNINAESRVKVGPGPAEPALMQQGWRVFLVKVHNEANVTAPLSCTSPNAEKVVQRSTSKPNPEIRISESDVLSRWMDVSMTDRQPLEKTLSGLAVEYRIVEIYSRDAGKREGKLVFDVGQGTQDLGFRNEVNVLFECEPSVQVVLDIIDYDGSPTTGQFEIRDLRDRIYPSRSRRMAPDFFFHDQIYRHSGESVHLPPGTYDVKYTRGPEYHIQRRTIEVPAGTSHREIFRLQRWIHVAELGWFSGDHHVHAAGCSHYDSPSQGVEPEDMMRHIMGEDLNVGCVLSWGPCWYYQKQFFEGKAHALSTPRYLMRYDVEVSGFPSSHAGHLTLLRLAEDDYPGTTKIDEWPSWTLPILQWGQQQGALVGYSHSGWGLKIAATSLPTMEMPPFDGIGANEYIVTVAHGACDFISTVDTPSIWELNIWYHTLNCGYTTRISGETDFPCIYGERVGLGRAYVKLPPDQPLDFDAWIDGIRDGRAYVSEGLSHLMDFQVGGLAVGAAGDDGRASVLAVEPDQSLEITANVATLLAEQPRDEIREKPLDAKPYWHVERARIEDSRQVPVELIVNGESVDQQPIAADGTVHEISFDYTLDRSSWIALRIFPSAHTNPVFVEVDGQPIRASKQSAQWCLDAVDVCWEQKKDAFRDSEREAAADAYETAREAYRQILAEADGP